MLAISPLSCPFISTTYMTIKWFSAHKNMLACYFCALLYPLLCLSSTDLRAQYNIAQGGNVTACSGTLSDSNVGSNGNDYGNNENHSFTVCVPDAESVLIQFDAFGTEPQYDYLAIYSGTDLNGNLLGGSPYSGNTTPPPLVLDNASGAALFCFTFQFVSDINVSDIGFQLSWQSTPTTVPPLQPFTIPGVACYAQTLFLNLSTPVLCSAVQADAFTIIGNATNPVVASAAPIACNAQGQCTQIALNLATSMGIGGQYDIVFDYTYTDACGNQWSSVANANFDLTDCPLAIPALELSNELCDNCATITALVTGGDGTYTYAWSPPLGNVGSTLICPAESELYSLTVTDGSGQSATQNVYVEVCPYQVNFIDAPTFVCGGGGCFNLVTAVTGGSPPYTYAWSVPPGNAPIGNMPFVAPYCLGSSGTFTVTVTDALGNTTSNSFFANVCPMQVSINSSDINCGCGDLIAQASGGAGGPWGNDYYYTYTWSPPIADNTATNPICPENPAIYGVTVSDIYGASATAEVFVPVCPFQVAINAPDVVCGDCVLIEAQTTPPPSPTTLYTYTWDPPLPNGNAPSDTLCITEPTIYFVTVTNQFGESMTANTIVDVCPLQINLPLPNICGGICTNLTTDAAGGAPPYTYTWNDAALSGDSPLICITSPTNYSVTVADALGATATAAQTVLPCDFSVQIVAPDLFCHCDSIYAQAVGGTWAYSYAWNPPLPASAGWHSLCLDNAIEYSVTVTDLGTGATAAATRLLEVCPFDVEIQGSAYVCNDTASFTALASGGYPPYTFAWNIPALPPSAGTHTLAIAAPTEFIVTVTDSGGYSVDDTLWVTPVEPPTLPDTFWVCLRDTLAPLSALPIGGTWSGDYINPMTGQFATLTAGIGNFAVQYSTDYCTDSAWVVVQPNPIMGDTVYCASPNAVALPIPDITGGMWSGSQVTDTLAGLFVPENTGIFTIQYTAPNACATQNTVTVLQGVQVSSPITQICSSPVDIDEFPTGGIWDVAPGLDFANGVLYPSGAGLGEHTLYYRIPGSDCADSITITVTDLAIGVEEIITCPQAGAFTLPTQAPATGGEWVSLTPSQTGLSNTTGWYNPALVGGGYEEYAVLSFDGCSDTVHISVIPTLITQDTLGFCTDINPLDLSGIGLPAGGIWSGTGIDLVGDTYYFDRSVEGTYILEYSVNGCAAALTVVVGSVTMGNDIQLCNPTEPILLPTPLPAGGTWSGTGIPTSGNGIFNPLLSGVGIFELVYTTPSGCADTLNVTVSQTDIPTIAPIEPSFCLRDTSIILTAVPAGGVWSGAGISGNTFNPVAAGAGGWLLTYSYGTAECATQAYLSVSVGDTLRLLSSPDTTICLGDPAILWAQAYGGKLNNYTYMWSNDLDHQQIQQVMPTENITYTLTLSDACSAPIVRQIQVDVSPAPTYSLIPSDTLCYGSMGTAQIVVPPDYTLSWQHDSAFEGTTLYAPTGNYTATVTDPNTQCSVAVPVTIPYYPIAAANFATNPHSSDDCLPTLTLQMTDYSIGLTDAYWHFGDGTTAPYIAGIPPTHTYATPGYYTISLRPTDLQACATLYEQTVCLAFENDLLLPNAFSPNADGINDTYRAVGIGIDVFELYIYNRWGQLVYSSQDMAEAWDGTYGGKACETGIYAYRATYSTTRSTEMLSLRGNITLLR